MDTQKKKLNKKSNWLAVTSALILHHALQVQFISQQWKKDQKNQIKNWINTLFFYLFWLALFVTTLSNQMSGGALSACSASPGEGGPPKTANQWRGQHCLLSTLCRQGEGGDTAKNLGIEYIILYIISMTQNVNRFIYSPMFKYICRLYTNSLENETANVFFFLPSLFFLTWYSEQWWGRGWWQRPCDAVEGIQRDKKVHSLKWATCFAVTK